MKLEKCSCTVSYVNTPNGFVHEKQFQRHEQGVFDHRFLNFEAQVLNGKVTENNNY